MNPIKLYTYRQNLPEVEPIDIENLTRREVNHNINWNVMTKHSRIGIVVGSRGISNINSIVKTVVNLIIEQGHLPIIIPAMGSHGGGTAEGQLKVLASLGINQKEMGCPIESSIETKVIGYVDEIPVHIDTRALTCQGLILINRIKAHTSFSGIIESGLLKMSVIGLGNPAGAELIHSFGSKGLQRLIPIIGQYIIANIPIILGLAVIENARKAISIIKGLKPEETFIEEQKLLVEAKKKMSRLPVEKLDILIIEEMGKCYSGTGIDTNIIGRLRVKDIPEPNNPDIEKIIVLDLAESSYGNATGVGLADFVTKNLVNKIDWQVTYRNVITTTFTQRGMLPIVVENEKEALRSAIASLGNKEIENITIMKIKNTLDLREIKISKNLIKEVKQFKGDLSIEPQEIICV